MPTVEQLRDGQGKTNFYKAHIYGEAEIVIEAVDRGTAANVYADIVGSHPDSISCSCCGPHGYCYSITQDWALEEIDNETKFIFEDEYTLAQVNLGAELFYDMLERGY